MATRLVTTKPIENRPARSGAANAVPSKDSTAPTNHSGSEVEKGRGVTAKKPKRAQPFPRKALILLSKSLAAMLSAQIPLSKALEFYEGRLKYEADKRTLRSVASAVSKGDDNYKAFAATGRFDSTFIGLVRAGTMASNLPAALRAVARQMKTGADFRSKIRKAIAGPLAILAFLWCLMIYSQTVLVPNVENLLNDIRQTPDGFTAVVFNFSHFVKAAWVPMTIFWIALALAFWRLLAFRQAVFKLLMSRWRLLKDIIMGFRQLTFIGTFEMMVSNNIPIADALETGARTLKDTPHEDELLEVKRKHLLGINLGEAIRKFTTFDPQLSHMIEVGEKASNLNEQLILLRDLYEEETANRIELFTGIVGLLSKILTVSVIAFIYIGTYLPIILAGPKMMQSSM
jgi:type II secretory pathway component PulF